MQYNIINTDTELYYRCRAESVTLIISHELGIKSPHLFSAKRGGRRGFLSFYCTQLDHVLIIRQIRAVKTS